MSDGTIGDSYAAVAAMGPFLMLKIFLLEIYLDSGGGLKNFPPLNESSLAMMAATTSARDGSAMGTEDGSSLSKVRNS